MNGSWHTDADRLAKKAVTQARKDGYEQGRASVLAPIEAAILSGRTYQDVAGLVGKLSAGGSGETCAVEPRPKRRKRGS